MRLYETTFILSPQADEATFDRQIKAVGDVIHRYEGRVVRENRWGIRRLAYPIKRFSQGYFTRVIFEANNTVLSELERFYKIEEPYIRYLTVLFEGSLEEEISRGYGEERRNVEESAPAREPIKVAEAPIAPVVETKEETEPKNLRDSRRPSPADDEI